MKMEFIKNDLLDSVLVRFYQTFSLTLDTDDYVPEKYNDKICKIIFKELKRKIRQVNKIYYFELKKLKQQQKSDLNSDVELLTETKDLGSIGGEPPINSEELTES